MSKFEVLTLTKFKIRSSQRFRLVPNGFGFASSRYINTFAQKPQGKRILKSNAYIYSGHSLKEEFGIQRKVVMC